MKAGKAVIRLSQDLPKVVLRSRPLSGCGKALSAVPANEHFRDHSRSAGPPASRFEFHAIVGKADNVAAVDAHKVRMIRFVRIVVAKFESANGITKVESVDNSRVFKFAEGTVDCRFVETIVREFSGDGRR